MKVEFADGKVKTVTMTQNEFLGGAFYDSAGLCLACGEVNYGVEPDAEQYECQVCGKHQVEGLESLLIQGVIEIEE